MEMNDRRFEVQERKGKSGWWTMEDWQFIDPDRFRLPQEGDIPIDQAIQWAGEALIREQGMRSEDLNSRMPAVHIEKYPGLGATIQYKYVVYFTPKDSSNGQFDSYADLDAETGKILRTYWRGRGSAKNAEQIQDGVNGFHTIEEIQSAKGENIDDLTLQERAYFLPDHGLPDERYISESTAVRIANGHGAPSSRSGMKNASASFPGSSRTKKNMICPIGKSGFWTRRTAPCFGMVMCWRTKICSTIWTIPTACRNQSKNKRKLQAGPS